MTAPPRYLPDRAFPPYAFVPGRAPHPRRDPAGHSFGCDDGEVADYEASRWRDCAEYLWGVDLYNHGYPWEAHEAWERLWIASRKRGDDRQTAFLQGLILCAAAAVKARVGEPASVARLCHRAAGRLTEVSASSETYMGLALSPFIAAIERFAVSDDWPLIVLAQSPEPR